jgi:hypothetical protein
MCPQTADSFSVHENPTAEDESDASSQLQQLQVELAEARRRIAQIKDAQQRVSNLLSVPFTTCNQPDTFCLCLNIRVEAGPAVV